MGKRPVSLCDFESFRLINRRPIYVTFTELYNWAIEIFENTQEGDDYHDALNMIEEAIGLAESLWNGSIQVNDPTNPDDTFNLIPFLSEGDMLDVFLFDYNNRYIGWPLFSRGYQYTDDNDEYWYKVCTVFCGKLKRAVMECGQEYFRKIRALSIEYNPIEDYWSKSMEKGGTAPYASIADGTDGTDISSWTTSNGKSEYKTTNELGTDGITNEHETSTQDSTTYRAEYRDTQKGTTTNKNEVPNSGYFRRRSEEGNKGTPIADLIKKEYELGEPLGEIFDEYMKKITDKTLLLYWVLDEPLKKKKPDIVTDNITILMQPEGYTIGIYDEIYLEIEAESDDPNAVLSYQWQYNENGTWENLPDGNEAELYIEEGPDEAGEYAFRCVVTSSKGGQAISDEAIIEVIEEDVITIIHQPYGATRFISSGSYPFYVEAESNVSSAYLTYQWQHLVDGIWRNLAGATSNPYNFSAPSAAGTRTYRCRIRSNFGAEVFTDTFDMTYVSIPIVGQKFRLGINSDTPSYLVATPDGNGGLSRSSNINDAAILEFTEDNKIKISGTNTYIETDSGNDIKIGTTGDTFIYDSVTYNNTNQYWRCYVKNSDNTRYLQGYSSGGYIGFKYLTYAFYDRIYFVE